jgi:cytochrome P450
MRWNYRPVPLLRECHAAYGDVFTLRLAGMGRFTLIADADLIKQTFTADPDVVRGGEGNAYLKQVIGPRSIMLLDGPTHLRERRLMLPAFSGNQIGHYAEVIRSITEDELDRWPLGKPFSLLPRTQSIALETILWAIFGMEDQGTRVRLRDALIGLMAATAHPALNLPWLRRNFASWSPAGRFVAARAALDELLFDAIARRRRDPELDTREDVFSALVRHEDDDGGRLTDRELRDELVTLLIAGHETTANGLAWSFELLFRHPHVLDRLVSDTLDGDGRYAYAVAQEALRIRPPSPFVARRLTEPYELNGWTVPARDYLAPCVYLIQRNPEIYPEPDSFRPERFLDASPGTYTYLPFGGGVHRCLGVHFAQMEMSIVLRTIVTRARLRAAHEDSERTAMRAIFFAPHRGVPAVLESRAERPQAPVDLGPIAAVGAAPSVV